MRAPRSTFGRCRQADGRGGQPHTAAFQIYFCQRRLWPQLQDCGAIASASLSHTKKTTLADDKQQQTRRKTACRSPLVAGHCGDSEQHPRAIASNCGAWTDYKESLYLIPFLPGTTLWTALGQPLGHHDGNDQRNGAHHAQW